jgi:hypothetical protein
MFLDLSSFPGGADTKRTALQWAQQLFMTRSGRTLLVNYQVTAERKKQQKREGGTNQLRRCHNTATPRLAVCAILYTNLVTNR